MLRRKRIDAELADADNETRLALARERHEIGEAMQRIESITGQTI